MRGFRSSISILLILSLSGCGSTVPCEVLNSFDRVRPARSSKRVCNEQEAGTTHVVVLSVAPWEDYVGALQPSFSMTSADALAAAVAHTGSLDSSVVSTLDVSAKVAGGIPGADGVKKPGDVSKVTAPDLGTPVTAASNVPAGLAVAALDVDPMLKHRAAASLFQEVQLLNRYVRDAAIGANDVVPYVVRMQVTLMPHARKEPYDTYATVSFFNGTAAAAEASTGSWAGPGLTEAITAIAQQREVMDQIKGGFNRERDSRYGLKPSDEPNQLLPPPRVLPLLVTDDIESTRFSDANERIRTIAAAAVAMSGTAQVSGGISKRIDDLKKALSNDFNSLLTVTSESDNTIRARLGAVRNGLSYAMVPQTHNITFLVLAPRQTTSISYVSQTTFRDAELGGRLLPRPEWRQRRAREILVKQWIDLWDVKAPVPDAAQQAFLFADAGDYTNFSKAVRAFLGEPARDAGLFGAIRDRMWLEIKNYSSANTISKGTFDLPLQGVAPFDGALTLVDNGTTASVQLIKGRNVNGGSLRAKLTAQTHDSKGNLKKVTIAPLAVVVSPTGDEASITFGSLKKLLSPGDGETINADLDTFYAPSPLSWIKDDYQTKSFKLEHFPVEEKKDDPIFSITPAAQFVVARHGTGNVQLLVARTPDPDFDGNIFFTLRGADVTTVPASVKLEKGKRVITEVGPIDLGLRNLTPLSEVVISAFGMKKDKKVPIDDVHIRVVE